MKDEKHIPFAELPDEQPEKWHFSPRLNAVVAQLPKPYGTRVFRVLLNADICTMDKLCSTPLRELRHLKNFGTKSIDALGTALATFGLHLNMPPKSCDVLPFVELSDDQPARHQPSPRLEAVLTRLPKKERRLRVENALLNAGIYTVSKLCAAPLRSQHHREVGKKTITEIETALGAFGLRLDDRPTVKHQTPAQRVASSVWLRAQIQDLIDDCEANILEDEKQAVYAKSSPHEDRYLARVESHRHWKRQLERILRGKTFAEDMRKRISP